MSNEEEYDYMSVNFLAEGASHDVRPGLQSRTEKRQSEIIKKKEISDMMNKKSNISMKKMEMKNLQLGLHMPISSSNKGFAMLEKMGFKPGTSLGKTGDGITEPIPVSINRNFREGLGVKAALEEMRQAKKQMRKEAKLNKQSVENFRSRVSEEVSGREAGIDLYKSQKTCFSLDTAEGWEEPLETFFWPANTLKKEENLDEEEEDEDDQLTVLDKLEMLTYYLRRTYFYCLWCGVKYDDEKDMQQECPGPTRSDH